MTRKPILFVMTLSTLSAFSHIGTAERPLRFFVVGGATGWIGQMVVALLKKQNYDVRSAQSRLENRQDMETEILAYAPDFVMNGAGVTGRPNVDWCEDHKQETIKANVVGALNLADICFVHNIHMTNFGTGCIYEYDAQHPLGSSIGFKETERPNFDGSFYSKTKIMLDTLLQTYPNVLNLRLRMPISDDLHARSFITKITRYAKVVNIPNSMTVLADLLPIAIDMTLKKRSGVYNFVNPGVISHNEILELYRKYIDPMFVYQNFTLEEQAKVIKAGRSNNELDASKMLSEYPDIPHIKESMIKVFERMKALKEQS